MQPYITVIGVGVWDKEINTHYILHVVSLICKVIFTYEQRALKGHWASSPTKVFSEWLEVVKKLACSKKSRSRMVCELFSNMGKAVTL